MPGNLVTPRDFLHNSEAPERIIATETEYIARRPDGLIVGDDIWRDAFFARATMRQLGGLMVMRNRRLAWLSNGAEMHPDVQQAEYCTPESLGPREATATSHAGPIILKRMNSASGSDFKFYRRSATVSPKTGAVETQGYHPNFCIPMGVANVQSLKPIETHLTTMFYGSSGIVTPQGYNIAPKSFDIDNPILAKVTARTGHSKPFALIRRPGIEQDPDNDVNNARDGFARLEGRCFTPSTRWSDFMAFGTTSILLRVLEHKALRQERRRFHNLALRNSIRTFHDMGKDMWMRQSYDLANGRSQMTVVDIQSNLYEIAASAAEKIGLPEDELLCLDEWQAICEDADQVSKGKADIDSIERIGWAKKYTRLVEKCGEGAVQSGGIFALRVCLTFDMVAPKGPLYEHFEKKTDAPEIVSDEMVEHYVTQPPQGTRAKVRSEYIRNPNYLRGRPTNIRWPYVELAKGVGKYVDHLHPYQTETDGLMPLAD